MNIFLKIDLSDDVASLREASRRNASQPPHYGLRPYVGLLKFDLFEVGCRLSVFFSSHYGLRPYVGLLKFDLFEVGCRISVFFSPHYGLRPYVGLLKSCFLRRPKDIFY